MTREEAIDVLKHNYPSSCYENLCTAVDMAIKALEQPEPCEDTISRQAAIHALNKYITLGREEQEQQARDIEIIQILPSAQPEPKKGKWIDYSDDGYVECPFCRSATNCDDNIDELHYCFSCGAKMEV